ncbi:MAG: hypothetical protein J3Q66DRAFT_407287 [Benniella sp.]|nr:MAG: hypothetical protein J3Q66DRAFT_407287 [Benniella sp.]
MAEEGVAANNREKQVDKRDAEGLRVRATANGHGRGLHDRPPARLQGPPSQDEYVLTASIDETLHCSSRNLPTGYDIPKTETAGASTQVFKIPGKRIQGYNLRVDACAGALTAFSSVFRLQSPGSQDQSRFLRPYLLMEVTHTKTVCFDLRTPSASCDLQASGLVCTGTNFEGILHVYLWDIRWSSIRLDYRQRPGVSVVTGHEAGCTATGRHPIFRNLDTRSLRRKQLAHRPKYSSYLEKRATRPVFIRPKTWSCL